MRGGEGAPNYPFVRKSPRILVGILQNLSDFLQNHNDRGEREGGKGYKNLCLIFTGNGNNFKF